MEELVEKSRVRFVFLQAPFYIPLAGAMVLISQQLPIGLVGIGTRLYGIQSLHGFHPQAKTPSEFTLGFVGLGNFLGSLGEMLRKHILVPLAGFRLFRRIWLFGLLRSFAH